VIHHFICIDRHRISPFFLTFILRWFQSAKDAQPDRSTAGQPTGTEMLMEQTQTAVTAFTG
jgi:hypothetical protein